MQCAYVRCLAKLKICQNVLVSDLPKLMLAKFSCHTVYIVYVLVEGVRVHTVYYGKLCLLWWQRSWAVPTTLWRCATALPPGKSWGEWACTSSVLVYPEERWVDPPSLFPSLPLSLPPSFPRPTRYRYTVGELQGMLRGIQQRAAAYRDWCVRVEQVLDGMDKEKTGTTCICIACVFKDMYSTCIYNTQ